MTAVEWGLLAIVCAGALIGLLRGAVRGVIDLVALTIGAVSAANAIPWIDEQLVGFGVDSRILLLLIAAVLIGLVTGKSFQLGLSPVNQVLLAVTLTVSTLTCVTGSTNVLNGFIHLVLFVTYLVLIFET